MCFFWRYFVYPRRYHTSRAWRKSIRRNISSELTAAKYWLKVITTASTMKAFLKAYMIILKSDTKISCLCFFIIPLKNRKTANSVQCSCMAICIRHRVIMKSKRVTEYSGLMSAWTQTTASLYQLIKYLNSLKYNKNKTPQGWTQPCGVIFLVQKLGNITVLYLLLLACKLKKTYWM